MGDKVELISDKNKCLDAGMDDFLPKPFHKNQLKAIIDKYFQKKTCSQEPE